jgi:hypothetical protein
VYVEDRRDADAALPGSGLEWTIIRPGRPTDDPGTCVVSLRSDVLAGDIPRAHVAAMLAEVPDIDDTVGHQWNPSPPTRPSRRRASGPGATDSSECTQRTSMPLPGLPSSVRLLKCILMSAVAGSCGRERSARRVQDRRLGSRALPTWRSPSRPACAAR